MIITMIKYFNKAESHARNLIGIEIDSVLVGEKLRSSTIHHKNLALLPGLK